MTSTTFTFSLLAILATASVACTAPTEEVKGDTAALTAPSPVQGQVTQETVRTLNALLHASTRATDPNTNDDITSTEALERLTSTPHPLVSVQVAPPASADEGFMYYVATADSMALVHWFVIEEHSDPLHPRYVATEPADVVFPSTAVRIPQDNLNVVTAVVRLLRERIHTPESPSAIELAKFATNDVSLESATFTQRPDISATYVLSGSILDTDQTRVGKAEMTIERAAATKLLALQAMTTRTLF